MFTLIENGEVYGPEPLGLASVLLADSTILKIGDVDRTALDKLELPVEVIDASGCIVTPAGGKRLFREGYLEFKESFLEKSNRVINLVGEG